MNWGSLPTEGWQSARRLDEGFLRDVLRSGGIEENPKDERVNAIVVAVKKRREGLVVTRAGFFA
jgi:hypothetical protein